MAASTDTARALILAALIAACGSKPEPTIGGARLVMADGVVDAAEGAQLVVTPGKVGEIPEAARVRVAIDRDVPFSTVAPLLDQLHEADQQPVLLVKDRKSEIKAIELQPPSWAVPSIRVFVTPDGKACVALPGVEEAKCVKTQVGHVDRAYTRELVREAVKAADLRHVIIEVDGAVSWADTVRAVDGARTCCRIMDEPVEMVVGVQRAN